PDAVIDAVVASARMIATVSLQFPIADETRFACGFRRFFRRRVVPCPDIHASDHAKDEDHDPRHSLNHPRVFHGSPESGVSFGARHRRGELRVRRGMDTHMTGTARLPRLDVPGAVDRFAIGNSRAREPRTRSLPDHLPGVLSSMVPRSTGLPFSTVNRFTEGV